VSAGPAFFQHIGDDPMVAAKLLALFPPPAARNPRQTGGSTPRVHRPLPVAKPSSKVLPRANLVPLHRPSRALAGRRLDASRLDLKAEIAKIQSVLKQSHLCEMLDRIESKPQRLVVAGLIVAATHPGLLAESDVRGWPLLAWHPEVARHLNSDSPYLRESLQTFAQRLRNGWLDYSPKFNDRVDESLHPELPVGWSTGAGITGGE